MKQKIYCAFCKAHTSALNKATMFCSECGTPSCDRHSYFYVDGNNIAITKNARPHCMECYNKKYKD